MLQDKHNMANFTINDFSPPQNSSSRIQPRKLFRLPSLPRLLRSIQLGWAEPSLGGGRPYGPLSLGSQIQYLARAPASTRMSKPVIISDSSEARKAAAFP